MSRIIVEDVSCSSPLDTFKAQNVFHEMRPPQLRAVREFTTYKGKVIAITLKVYYTVL